MEESAEIRRQQYESMLDAGDKALAAFDREGRLIYRNAADRQLFNSPPTSDSTGQPVAEYLANTRWFNVDHKPLMAHEMPIVGALRGLSVESTPLIAQCGSDNALRIVQNARPIIIDGEVEGAVVFSEKSVEPADLKSVGSRNFESSARQSRLIAEMAMEINDNTSALDLGEMTTFAIERIAHEFRADSGMLWLLDDRDQLTLHATYNTDPTKLAPAGYPLESFEFAHEALETNQPLVVASHEFKAPEAIVECLGGAESTLVIPLQVRGESVGIAYLCLTKDYTLNRHDRLFASVWGRQFAQAIDIAQLVESIENANERLAFVINQLPQAVLLIDANGHRVRIANAEAERLFGRSFTDNVPIADLTMTTPDGLPMNGDRHPLLQAMLTGERITGKSIRIPRPDGVSREVIGNHVPIRDSHGTVVGGISILQDRADFAAMDRARDEFLAVVGHELRNPLTSIRGNLQLLERKIRRRSYEDLDDDLSRISIAIHEVDRVDDLIARVLDVARAGMGQLDIQPAPMDAAQLVRDICDAARARLPNREVVCDVPDRMLVTWDADRVYQVLANLTQNADRYAAGTPVEVRLWETTGDHVRISVRDHGPGVPDEIRHRLFRQYYRFDGGSDDSLATMTDGSRGLGIGLYVSARLAQLHGGSLHVRDATGGGAQFILDMPKIAKIKIPNVVNFKIDDIGEA